MTVLSSLRFMATAKLCGKLGDSPGEDGEALTKGTYPRNYIMHLLFIPPQLCPNADFSQELGGPLDREAWLRERAAAGVLPRSGRASPSLPTPPSGLSFPPGTSQINLASADLTEDDGLEPSDDELSHMTLTQTMQKIRLDPVHPRFFGKSSGIRLLQTALDLKSEYAGEPKPTVEETKERFLSLQSESERRDFWKPKAVRTDSRTGYHPSALTCGTLVRVGHLRRRACQVPIPGTRPHRISCRHLLRRGQPVPPAPPSPDLPAWDRRRPAHPRRRLWRHGFARVRHRLAVL
jgi:hypothetical protein